jgi:dCMP deaminase
MCKRLIINAGITNVIIRDTIDAFRNVVIDEWILEDDTLGDFMGY